MVFTKISTQPRNVTLQLTEACNLRCTMCYFWGETGTYSTIKPNKKPDTLDIDLLLALVRKLSTSKPHYSLFGGEPLIYPHLEELIRIIKKSGSSIDTPTNGTLLTEHAKMLVKNNFDLVRVSIDGPREINDKQRGKGSFNKAMEGIETLQEEKLKTGANLPSIEILYTVTPENFHSIEQFALKELNIDAVDQISFQMENFLTEQMGLSYANLLKSEFNIISDEYWRGLVRAPSVFNKIDVSELAKQVNNVRARLKKKRKLFLLEPPTYTPENLLAYIKAEWNNMIDQYETCYVPWVSVDVTATGNIAPCHIFYDLVMGNLYENSFKEIWNGENYQKFRSYMIKHKLLPICSGCCILYLAGKKKRKLKKNTT